VAFITAVYLHGRRMSHILIPRVSYVHGMLMEAWGQKQWSLIIKPNAACFFLYLNTDVVESLSGKILQVAKESGAHLIVVACPLCQSNLDMRQPDIEKHTKTKIGLPVMYFTQLMALAFGFP